MQRDTKTNRHKDKETQIQRDAKTKRCKETNRYKNKKT